MVVPARQQARPAHGTEGRHVEFLDPNAFPGQTVHIRRPQEAVAMNADVPVALVVRQNQNDVRPVGGRFRYEIENGADHDEKSRSPRHALHSVGSHLRTSFRGARPMLRMFGQRTLNPARRPRPCDNAGARGGGNSSRR